MLLPNHLIAFKKSLHSGAQKMISGLLSAADSHSAFQDGRWQHGQRLTRQILDVKGKLAREIQDGGDREFISELKDHLASLQEQHASHVANDLIAPWPDTDALVEWMNKNRGEKFDPCIPADVKLKKGQSAFDAWAEQGLTVADQRAQLERTGAAQVASEEAEAFAVREIERLAAAGAPDFRPTLHLEPFHRTDVQGSIRWPQMLVDDRGKTVLNGAALAVWLNRDVLIERAKKEIRAAARGDGLTSRERRVRAKELAASLLEAQRVEEVLFRLAVEDGNKIVRSRDSNMLAILQIQEAK